MGEAQEKQCSSCVRQTTCSSRQSDRLVQSDGGVKPYTYCLLSLEQGYVVFGFFMNTLLLSPTSMHLHHFTTLFTFDVAAPVELTAAPVHHLHLLSLEAPPTTHKFTAINGF